VLLRVSISGLPPGEHAFHIHETGRCEPPFDSAGGHFNPAGKKHGLLAPEGKHAGDLPNLHVPADGALKLEVLATEVMLAAGSANSLLDSDGAALVVHRDADDYRTDPAGAAGPRIACGVIEAE
jgi:Cu-Zn family superoxide dismutase